MPRQIYNAGNDFVAAFSAGLRDRLAGEAEARAKAEDAAQQKFREEQLKLLQEQNKRAAEHDKMQIDLQRMNLDSAIRQQFLSGARQPLEYEPTGSVAGVEQVPESLRNILGTRGPDGQQIPLESGVSTPSELLMSPTRTQTISTPSGTKMTLEGLSFPKDIQQQKLEELRQALPLKVLEAGAIASAQAPAKVAVAEATAEAQGKQARQTEDLRATNAKALEGVKQTNKLAQIEKTVEGQKAVAKIKADATIAAASVRAKGQAKVDSEAIADTAALSATGQADITGTSNNAMAARSLVRKLGFVPFMKKDADKLKAVHDVDILTRDMEEIINSLPTSRAGAMGQNVLSKIPSSALANLKALIKSRAANVSHTAGGEIGRLSDPDVERAMGIMLAPGITRDEAIRRMRSFNDEYAGKIMHNILGGMGNKQKLLVLLTHDFDPSKIGGITKGSNGKTYHTFVKNPQNGEWGYFDPKTNKYFGMDE